MNCPKCHEPMKLELELFGGCKGHESGERCYCSEPDARVVWVCRFYGKRGALCKRYGKAEVVAKLTDAGSIARWIADRLEVTA